jgi:hypothetical protein
MTLSTQIMSTNLQPLERGYRQLVQDATRHG